MYLSITQVELVLLTLKISTEYWSRKETQLAQL